MRGLTMATATLTMLLLGGVAQARVYLDYQDAEQIGKDITREIGNDETLPGALDSTLQALGTPAGQAPAIRNAAIRRLEKEAVAYAAALEGQGYDSMEGALDAVRLRVRILRYDALNNPKAYASGRGMSYVVSDSEMARIGRGLAATYIEREVPLRDRLNEMVNMEEMDPADLQAVRILSREIAMEHAKEALVEIKGAPFYNQFDAENYVAFAIDAAIDSIRDDKLAEPDDRATFIQEARTRVPSSVTSAIDNGFRTR